eukprot:962953-Pyramimonas_sp.AAC.1
MVASCRYAWPARLSTLPSSNSPSSPKVPPAPPMYATLAKVASPSGAQARSNVAAEAANTPACSVRPPSNAVSSTCVAECTVHPDRRRGAVKEKATDSIAASLESSWQFIRSPPGRAVRLTPL